MWCATKHMDPHLSGFVPNHIENEAVYAEIQRAVHEFGVIFMREQPLEQAQFVRLGKAFGELKSTYPVFGLAKEHPEIQLITFKPDAPIETQAWHTDNTYNDLLSAYTFLRAVDIPTEGGDSPWASNGAVYDNLSEPVQEMLSRLIARHDLYWRLRESNYLLRAGKAGTDAHCMSFTADHPVVIRHPVTGRAQIFVHRHFTSGIHHMHEEVSKSILDMLFNMVKQPDYQVRLTWQPNTVAIWDKWATQHYAAQDYSPYPRAMTRMVGKSKIRPQPLDTMRLYDSGINCQRFGLITN